jgi:transposase
MSVDVVLYDLTTLRFESTREDIGELRRFGYSKENRSDCTQVILGLLVDTDGIPLGFEVYPGNTFEGHTLAGIVTRMREKFRVRRFIFVADRGLFSANNLKHIRKDCGTSAHEKGEFIVGMKLGIFKNRHDEFYDRSRFTSLDDHLEIYETTHGEDRLIIAWSQARADRDRKTREDILEKIKKKLKSPKADGKTFISNTNYCKYVTGLNKGAPQLNKGAISREALRDGFFGIITNVPKERMSASEILTAYKHLWIIEDAFGEIKGTLKTRPIFHWTDERIIGHLTFCFLAYFCEAQITKLLRRQNIEQESPAVDNGNITARPLTVSSAMQELKEVRAIPVDLRGKTAWVRTDIKGNAAKIFKAMGIAIPPKLLMFSSKNLPAQIQANVVAQTV